MSTPAPPDRHTSAAKQKWRLGTHDDKGKAFNPTEPLAATKASYERIDHVEESYFIERKSKEDAHQIYLLTQSRSRAEILTLRVLDETFDFHISLLKISSSTLALIPEVTRLRATRQTSRDWASFQHDINGFAQSYPEVASDAIRVFHKFVYTKGYDTCTIRSTQDNNFYVLALQTGCIKLAHILKDPHFEKLAVMEIEWAWTGLLNQRPPLTMDDYQALLSMRPLLDRVLFHVCKKYKTYSDPQKSYLSHYPDSRHNVHPESWKRVFVDIETEARKERAAQEAVAAAAQGRLNDPRLIRRSTETPDSEQANSVVTTSEEANIQQGDAADASGKPPDSNAKGDVARGLEAEATAMRGAEAPLEPSEFTLSTTEPFASELAKLISTGLRKYSDEQTKKSQEMEQRLRTQLDDKLHGVAVKADEREKKIRGDVKQALLAQDERNRERRDEHRNDVKEHTNQRLEAFRKDVSHYVDNALAVEKEESEPREKHRHLKDPGDAGDGRKRVRSASADSVSDRGASPIRPRDTHRGGHRGRGRGAHVPAPGRGDFPRGLPPTGPSGRGNQNKRGRYGR